MSETPQETRTATGRCTEISERGEWTTFHVDVGSQYPVKLATKLAPLVELGRTASKSGDVFDWTYTERESDRINEHTGKPFVNRYLSGVVAAGTAPAATGSSRQASTTPGASHDGMTPEKWDAKERRDYRSRAWAQTISAFSHTVKVDEDPLAVFGRLQPFQRKLYEDICQSFAYPGDDSDVPF